MICKIKKCEAKAKFQNERFFNVYFCEGHMNILKKSEFYNMEEME